jgi:A/G-specific adenine glycosylase
MASVSLSDEKIMTLQERLLAWFQANRRDLPWRQTRDPYRILVSEVMLQQTQVDRVLPYYSRFLERFPTVEHLAGASTTDVIQAWAGLGYNRRAVNLQRTARYVTEHFDGAFPHDIEALRRLPGVGPYTAGAIACFAFEQDVVFLDTNIRRVLHRILAGIDVPRPTATDRELLEAGAAALPPGRGWEWNQAIMEFGALHCTARKPLCVVCPLQPCCAAFPEIQTVIAALPRGTRLKREAPFKESNRYYRGRVLAVLREHAAEGTTVGMPLRDLGTRIRDDFSDAHVPWLYDVVDGLQRDGLAAVAEDTPSYDAESPDPISSDITVRLP